MTALRKVVPTLLMLTGVLTAQVSHEVFSETKDREYWRLTLIVPAERITLREMEKTAREFVQRAGSRKVIVLSVFSTRDIAVRERGLMCQGYRPWRRDYDELARNSLVAANMITIAGDSVLRLRSADGAVRKSVLSGKDPTLFSIAGVFFEILFVSERKMTGLANCDVRGEVAPDVFVRTDAKLTPELCARAITRLAERIRRKNVTASFRNDHWFACHPGFPVLYPFMPPAPPPAEKEYLDSSTYTCGVYCEGEKATCTQTWGPPRDASTSPKR